MYVNVLLSLTLCVAAVGIPRAAWASDIEGSPDLTRAKAMVLNVCMVLQEQAERRERDGHPAGLLARAIAVEARLNDAETEALLGVVSRLRSRVRPLDDRASAIIQAARQKYPEGLLPPGTQPAPLPPELADLQRQRDSFVAEAIRELDGELGLSGMVKFDTFLATEMRRRRLQKLPLQTPNEIGPPGEPSQADSLRKETAR